MRQPGNFGAFFGTGFVRSFTPRHRPFTSFTHTPQLRPLLPRHAQPAVPRGSLCASQDALSTVPHPLADAISMTRVRVVNVSALRRIGVTSNSHARLTPLRVNRHRRLVTEFRRRECAPARARAQPRDTRRVASVGIRVVRCGAYTVPVEVDDLAKNASPVAMRSRGACGRRTRRVCHRVVLRAVEAILRVERSQFRGREAEGLVAGRKTERGDIRVVHARLAIIRVRVTKHALGASTVRRHERR